MKPVADHQWQELQAGLRTFIHKRVGSAVDTEDLLQEVFLRMHDGIDAVKDERKFVAWLYQITRHVIVDYHRAAQSRREVPVGAAPDLDAASPQQAMIRQEDDEGIARRQLASCLRPMLMRLGPDYREALELVELQGLTQVEAAKRVGLSLSGMKSRVQRGRERLRTLLDQCCLIQLDARKAVTAHTPRDRQRCPC